MMKKKIHAFLMMFLIIISLFIGCNNASEQGNSVNQTQDEVENALLYAENNLRCAVFIRERNCT